jgi:glycosyltransferase involved in cell wall biosynthesis
VLFNRFYYQLKPFVPRSLRFAVRRAWAERRRHLFVNEWPIDPAAARQPKGWVGWPKGKNFALVLTHDVEGPRGLAACEKLMALEEQLGFRSSFNFIPEGSYRVHRDLREKLANQGFEVGVHDLRHDGKLYREESEFAANAARINEYLKIWGAAGFRSGFMHHNLHWLHQLDVLYDASTFDTDPFEPQPQGQRTIFPFWVPRPCPSPLWGEGARRADEVRNGVQELSTLNSQPSTNDSGYVELPYTLPQDSTLYLLLGERGPAIWKEKLDWIAAHGGMALLNVHPDYMQFPGESPQPLTYPVEWYVEFLRYVKSRYEDTCWHALPREVAQFVKDSPARPSHRRPLRVGMVTHSYYETDNRVKRYAEALAHRGDSVDVLALRRSPNVAREEVLDGVNVFRVQDRFGKEERSKLSYLLPLARFLFRTSAWIARRHSRASYDVLHVHNIPDFVVFAALYPKLTGARVVLDIHDIVPEFFASKFNTSATALPIRLLRIMEKASSKVAHRVIIANDLWLERYATRTGANGKCAVFINNVDTRLFRTDLRRRADDKRIVLFPGGLQWHQGVDIAIRAFRQVRARVPHAEFHIYGDGNMKEQLVALASELGLADAVHFFRPVPVQEVAAIMANADVGVVPKRADSFGNEAYSTKIMEFMALGVPVVVSSTRIDRFYFTDDVVRFFESGNVNALANALIGVLEEQETRAALVARALQYVAANNWSTRKPDYLNLLDSLVAGTTGVSSVPFAVEPGDSTAPRAKMLNDQLATAR